MHFAMKHTRVIAAAAALIVVAPLTACASYGSSTGTTTHGQYAPLAPNTGGSSISSEEADAASADMQATPFGAERSVIMTGSITVEVEDPRGAVELATDLATSLGGYVESQSMYGSGTDAAAGANLTIRVPQSEIDAAYEALGELGSVLDENRTATDVTAQHVDLQARVESLETSVARLTDLMAGAATTSELIEAESALAARQAELDGLKAQLTMLEDQVDESTIWVAFTTKSVLPGGGPTNFWEGLIAGLGSISAAASGSLVVLGVLLPWLVIAAIVTFAVIALVRSGRKRRARRVSANPTDL